jgi:hypothetical protein
MFLSNHTLVTKTVSTLICFVIKSQKPHLGLIALTIRDTLIRVVWFTDGGEDDGLIMLMVKFLVFFPFGKGTFWLTTWVNAKT